MATQFEHRDRIFPEAVQPGHNRLRIAVCTLGCRLNRYESDGLLQRFVESGRYESVELEEGPDIAIINTCTVTDQADNRNLAAIRRVQKYNPAARILLTGCYAQTDPDELRSIPGVVLVVGNDHKTGLLEMVEELLATNRTPLNNTIERDTRETVPGYGARPVLKDPFAYGYVLPRGHTRAYVKIQDGCDRRCTYCKIPMARGAGISRPVGDILEHIQELDRRGVPEVVLTGVNLGWYRDRDAGLRFNDLLERILIQLRNTRLRISSIEPCDVGEGLAELMRHPRFCDFLHIPLQSGSDRILKAMRRTYRAHSFIKRVETVRRYNPDVFVGTDVMVGFPGESEADFAMTVDVCRSLEMANIHAFPFSPRRGTPAAALQTDGTKFRRDQNDSHEFHAVDRSIVRERMRQLSELHAACFERYARRQFGSLRTGIIEKLSADLHSVGDEWRRAVALTDNFLRVHFNAPAHIRKGDLIELRIADTHNAMDRPGHVFGHIQSNSG
ncbi:MAG: tRNA (N(6)-L-threonylcarbamoyladenosine(37)-C(2))-methylthiotransferase MtaB [Leptospiraceae bacterium]|nr:tRNA (N(6)-L-threonylcarbamoyladenosine(37)-C(2))-methylthiotransferase MtaB [Leptospiraceae bacterium]MCB1315227.1 tRNA (N(6)-L-threonylcarbamoyladenosine(37)-C(2))-methylthiotransferase MtaB [Leptospiraceae bacterium]MCB1319592.1 tRNA (N(6)-L-threonylcarbamoyladenosine(37)-C(2))-methylthiotransferase MtaB [Leptospiraceae bacterium]